ncbi:MAG: M20/M25/M40 family metallo-hydrolase [Sphingomicrobium sp.]
MKTGLPAAAAALLFIPTEAPAAPSPAEQQMIATVDAEQQRTLDMLERWVNQNSGSHNLPGVEAVGRMVRAELEPLGFAVRWIPLPETGRAGHLVAIHKGKAGRKRLLLIGHLDTVFERDSPFQRWVRNGDSANGPGASDDKGGDAVIVAALRAMHSAGALSGANIEIVLTGDEEDSGSPLDVARRDLVTAGRRADAALDFEGLAQENGLDMGSVARRGVVDWTLRVTGRAAHSSGVFSPTAGYGANYELARILDSFRRQLPEDKLTYNVGLIAGGTTAALDRDEVRASVTGKTNVIAAQAVARGDLRAISPEKLTRATASMRAIVAQSLPGARAEILFDGAGYPPMPPTPGNEALLAALNAVNRDLGLAEMPPLDPIKRGAGDISFVAGDTDGLVGMGPSSSGDHTNRETVDIPSIFKQAKRAAILMSRLAREQGEPAARNPVL